MGASAEAAIARHVAMPGVSVAKHESHALHHPERHWREKNCYVDLWIEFLHAQGLQPLACLPFVFAMDFEGDHWTFYKPPAADVRLLYGIDVQELAVWRPLIEHAAEHLAAGKLLTVEADAFWLPDTAATDYRREHVKTTILLNDLDLANRRLGYFHNAGYHALDGEDFDRLFSVEKPEGVLSPYVELVRIDRVVQRSGAELRTLAAGLLDEHLAWRPATNPIDRFARRFVTELPLLQAAGLAGYHRWAFAGLRQLGSAFELAAAHLRWAQPDGSLEAAAVAFELIAQHSKAFVLKAARAVNAGRSLDAAPLFIEMSAAWDAGMGAVDAWRQAEREAAPARA